ncbi:MAG: DsbA family protein [Motiliproteus sp.]
MSNSNPVSSSAAADPVSPLQIDYYTDLLCVWAWIAQRQIDEMKQQWGSQVQLRNHYTDIFGDVPGRMANQWKEKGGYGGFADHVQHSAAPYDNAPVHPELWRRVRPSSSFPAHLLLKACLLSSDVSTESEAEANTEALALALRQAFFVDALDISDSKVLMAIAERAGLKPAALQAEIDSGRAAAAVMADYQKARQQQVKGSPSWVMNDGRQTLYGNIGYRVLHANIEEQLRHPEVEACWC